MNFTLYIMISGRMHKGQQSRKKQKNENLSNVHLVQKESKKEDFHFQW